MDITSSVSLTPISALEGAEFATAPAASATILKNVTPKKQKKKKIATMLHPTLQAIVHELFRFEDKDIALGRLKSLKENFIVSKEQPADDLPDGPYVRLWIKGYSISKKQKIQGAKGNYALIGVREVEKRFTLYAIKEDVAVKVHPQRKRPKQQHPDWGHPILRNIRKEEKHIFNTLEAAELSLKQMHEQFPNTSIPGRARLFIMIYSKPEHEGDNPVKKWVLEIKAAEKGGFYIDYKENVYKPKAKSDKPALPKLTNPHMESVAEELGEEVRNGYFASMVQVKRASKGRAPIKKVGAEALARKPDNAAS